MRYQVKTALLAYGSSGKLFHAPFITVHPGFDLSGILERNEKRASADVGEILSYDTLEGLLDDGEIELVVVNTPNNLHYEHCMAALKAGKHVLVEKPVCTTAAEARSLYAEAKSRGLHMLAYQNRRFDSDYMAMKTIIKGGTLGRLCEVQIRFDRYRPTPGPKAFKERPVPGAGIQYDLGAHIVDQAIDLFGPPRTFKKVLGKNRPGTEVDDSCAIILEYSEGPAVYLYTGFNVLANQAAYVAYGTLGSFSKPRADEQENQLREGVRPGDADYGKEKPGNEATVTHSTADGRISTEVVPGLKGNYMDLYDAVYETIVNGVAYPITETQVVSQLQILGS